MDSGFLAAQVFDDRRQAGRELAAAVAALEGLARPIVLALPRGGVPVGFEVARLLGAPLDVLVVRKIGVPGQEELALGAVASGGACYVNAEVVAEVGLPRELLDRLRDRELVEVERRNREYRGDRPMPDLAKRSVIIVDDGAATGATVEAAISALRGQAPAEIVVGLPVAPADTCQQLAAAADRLVCLHRPVFFYALGAWYVDFSQVSDDEVRDLLAQADHLATGQARAGNR